MQHHLVAVAGGPAVQVRRQRRFGQQTERVGPTLCRRHFLGHPFGLRRRLSLAEQPIGRRLERALDDRAHLGRQAASDDDHAVVVDPGRQLPMQMSRLGLCRCGRLIDPTPRADEAFDVGGRAGLREVEQRGLVLRRGHAGQRPHLGVRDRAARHRGADGRQRGQRVRDPHLLTRCAQGNPGAPVQPVGTRSETAVPAGASIELAQEHEQFERAGMEPRCQRRDPFAQASVGSGAGRSGNRGCVECLSESDRGSGHAPSSHRSFCRVRSAAVRRTPPIHRRPWTRGRSPAAMAPGRRGGLLRGTADFSRLRLKPCQAQSDAAQIPIGHGCTRVADLRERVDGFPRTQAVARLHRPRRRRHGEQERASRAARG